MIRAITLIFSVILISFTATANNMQITNISTAQVNGNIIINFNLSWENSWRTASTNNYDGAWVFFKFKDTDGQWKPLRFSGTNVTAPAGYNVDISNNGPVKGVGALVYRSALGFGPVNLTGIKAGIEPLPGTFDVKGIAIEMVYVPQGSFFAGDGTGIAGKSYQSGASVDAYQVIGNGSTVNFGSAAGQLNGTGEKNSGNLAGFPVGYAAFWMMKYELSIGGWRDFLNMLSYTQQENHFSGYPPNAVAGSSIGGVVSNIKIITPGIIGSTPAIVGCDYDKDNIYNEPTDGEWRAMSWLGWPEVAAYLDWAGLRPMTELEFEKACRGPLPAVEGEFAWGTPDIASTKYTITNPGQNNETVSNPSSTEGNAVVNATLVTIALRGGAFATAFSTRVSAGAGYYGAMELSGNRVEVCVTTWNKAGRSFTGKQGDGKIDIEGYANENYWPGINGNSDETVDNSPYTLKGVTGDAGLIFRGSELYLTFKMSLRNQPIVFISRELDIACRGVREASQ